MTATLEVTCSMLMLCLCFPVTVIPILPCARRLCLTRDDCEMSEDLADSPLHQQTEKEVIAGCAEYCREGSKEHHLIGMPCCDVVVLPSPFPSGRPGSQLSSRGIWPWQSPRAALLPSTCALRAGRRVGLPKSLTHTVKTIWVMIKSRLFGELITRVAARAVGR